MALSKQRNGTAGRYFYIRRSGRGEAGRGGLSPTFASEILVGAPNFASKNIGDKYCEFCPLKFRYDAKIGIFSPIFASCGNRTSQVFLLFSELGWTLPQICLQTWCEVKAPDPGPLTSKYGSTLGSFICVQFRLTKQMVSRDLPFSTLTKQNAFDQQDLHLNHVFEHAMDRRWFPNWKH